MSIPKTTAIFYNVATLSLGLALSGCATQQFNSESCTETEVFQGKIFSYNSGTNFSHECQLGKLAAATVNIRNPDGSLKPTALPFHESIRKTLSPAALSSYEFFLKQNGITQKTLAEIRNRPRLEEDHGLNCKDVSAGARICL